MARKIRKDITVGGLEKKLKLAPGTITNPDGRDARSDKKLETLQKEAEKLKKKTSTGKSAARTVVVAMPAKKKTVVAAATKPVTADQKIASLRKVKSNPKASASMVKKVQAAIKKTAK